MRVFLLLIALLCVAQSEVCHSKLDLVLVLDGSGSISAPAFQQAKQFCVNLASSFNFGPTNTRLAAVQFSGVVRKEFSLLDNKAQAIASINAIQKNLGTGTNIAAGIDTANTILAAARPDAVHSMLVMTDGKQSVAGDPIASANRAKSQNMEIFVIAIGSEAAKYANVLTNVASEPKARHYFQISGFDQLKDILSKLINATCPAYSCTQTPNHGPAAGGTIVTVTGENFPLSGPNYHPKCMFGSTIVDANVLNPNTLQCKSPPGPKGQTVSFKLSFDGATWTDQGCQFTYDEYKPDPCAQWSQNCSFCISHPFCGWCSQNVTHPDGTFGAQCAGFNHTSGGDEQHFTCVGTFNTEQCEQGYLCDQQTATCNLADPGNGGPKDACERNCGVGLIYFCDKTQNKCQLCPSGTPGCVSSLECKDECFMPHPPAPSPPAVPGVPGDLQNTIWRGLQIDRQYQVGEVQLKFSTSKAWIYYVTSNILLSFNVATQGEILVFTSDDNTVLKSRYLTHYVGQVVAITVATGAPGADAPAAFDPAMTDPTQAVHVFGRCLNSATCTFKWTGPPTSFGNLINHQKRSIEITDFCMNFTTCTSCIGQPTCGWCSTPVVYNDGTPGKNCAGFNPDGSKFPFVCSGAFSSDSCVVAPTTYECEPRSKKCIESRPGFGTDFPTCNATCNRPLPPAQNVTPIALQGRWRGLQIQNGYVVGEWRALFGATNLLMEGPGGTAVGVSGDVQSTEDQIWIQTAAGLVRGKWQIVNGPETKMIGLAFGLPGGDVPFDFGEAMTTPGFTEYWFQSCLQQKQDAGTCLWDH